MKLYEYLLLEFAYKNGIITKKHFLEMIEKYEVTLI